MSRNTKDSTIRNREHFIWTGVTEKKRKNPSSKSVPVAQALTALISDQVKPIDKVSSPNLINKETTKLKRICTATKIGTTQILLHWLFQYDFYNSSIFFTDLDFYNLSCVPIFQPCFLTSN